MNDHIRQRLPDLIGAALAIGLGSYAWIASGSYAAGTLRDMGPGYFPRLIAAGLVCLGLLLAATTLKSGPTRFGGDRPELSSVLLIGAGLISFALLIERNGLLPAVFVAVLLSTFASDHRNISRSVLLAALTAGACVAVFVYGLNLPMKVFAL